MGAKILIVDDEAQIQKLLRVTLQAHGYTTIEANTGRDGVIEASFCRPDLIILDLGLPDGDGLNALMEIREWSKTPVIILTVRNDETGMIHALDSGADDYVTKPFGMGELMARIRLALRHVARSPDEPVLYFGPLTIDIARRLVLLDNVQIKLTPIEYELLKVLATNVGRVMTHRQLLRQVWGGQSYDTASHYLRVYVGHLRKKIEHDSTRPTFILTEPGVGYRFMSQD